MLVDQWADNLLQMNDYTRLFREAASNMSVLVGETEISMNKRASWRELYRQISSRVGGDKKASLLLNKYGIKGLRYNGRRDGECAVVWDEESIKILNALEQGMQSGPRGTYMPQNTSDTNSMSGVMTLMQTCGKSTFLHESAHVRLDAEAMLAKGIVDKVFTGQESKSEGIKREKT